MLHEIFIGAGHDRYRNPRLFVVHPEIRVLKPVHFCQCFGIRKERPNSRIHFKVFKRTTTPHKFVVAVQRRQVSLHPNQKSFSSRMWQDAI